MSRSLRLALAGCLVALPVWVWAQTPKPNAATSSALPSALPRAMAAPSAQTPGNVTIVNDSSGTVDYNYATGVGLMTKNVVLRQVGEKFVLRAQRVRYSKNDNRATASGDLFVETKNSTIRGAQIYGDFNAKIISFTGNVVISAHGKGDGMNPNNPTHKPVRISCNRLDWNYATSQATIAGNIRMVQDDVVGTCNKIIFNEQQNAVNLLGNVRFGNSKQQQFLGEDVVIYLDESRIVTNKGVVMKSSSDADAGPKQKSTPKPPTDFPDRAKSNPVAELPAPPPPIETLVPTPTPKPKPTARPTPRPTAAPEAAPPASEAENATS